MRRLDRSFAPVLWFALAAVVGCRPGAAGDAAVGDGERPAVQEVEPASAPPAPQGDAEPETVGPAGPVVETPRSFGHADVDPGNDDQVGPPEALADCETRLEAAGIEYAPARIGLGKKKNGVHTCGAAQVVRYVEGPAGIRYRNGKGTKNSRPLLTCQMALALADFEAVVQEVATVALGQRVLTIDHLGTFNCREMALYDLVSEHSFANGIDFRRFNLEDGTSIGVLEDFRPEVLDGEASASTRFLRTVGHRLFDEAVFSNVITPYFDRAHRNHIHCDLARYRVDGSRP